MMPPPMTMHADPSTGHYTYHHAPYPYPPHPMHPMHNGPPVPPQPSTLPMTSDTRRGDSQRSRSERSQSIESEEPCPMGGNQDLPAAEMATNDKSREKKKSQAFQTAVDSSQPSSSTKTGTDHQVSNEQNETQTITLQTAQAAIEAIMQYKKDTEQTLVHAAVSQQPVDISSQSSISIPPPTTLLSQPEASPPPNNFKPPIMDGDIDIDADADADGEADAEVEAVLTTSVEEHNTPTTIDSPIITTNGHGHPRPLLDHLMTEDGVTMLNPAELLTQESLASPPQS